MLDIWRKPYTLRQFEPQTYVDLMAESNYTDKIISVDVQEQSPTEFSYGQEGASQGKKLKVYGDFAIRTDDENANTKADMLFYKGKWYKCTSSVEKSNLLLSRYRSEFEELPGSIDIEPPVDYENEAGSEH